jgi:hypothetical protein
LTDLAPVTQTPVQVCLEFAHAALQHIADRAGVDLLHIKGRANDPTIAEVVGPGSDADVLIRPAHVERLLQQLPPHGWRQYSGFEWGSPFGHAATYIHDSWGFGDLHRLFPGIGLRADDAFNRLWACRSTTLLAGVPCFVPSLTGQTMIMVLNAARAGPESPRSSRVRLAWERLPASSRDEVWSLVVDLRAEVAFSAGLGEMTPFRGRREYLLWKVISQGGTRLEEWVARVWAAPSLGAAVHVAARAPRVNTEHLAIRLGHRPSRADVTKEFLLRPYRGAREELRRRRARHT